MDREALRKRRGGMGCLTQAEFARKIGMKPNNYRNRENGKVKFKLDEVAKVCEALDWTLEEGMKFLL